MGQLGSTSTRQFLVKVTSVVKIIVIKEKNVAINGVCVFFLSQKRRLKTIGVTATNRESIVTQGHLGIIKMAIEKTHIKTTQERVWSCRLDFNLFEHLDSYLHFYCYIHMVSADAFLGLLLVFHVKLGSPQVTLEWSIF